MIFFLLLNLICRSENRDRRIGRGGLRNRGQISIQESFEDNNRDNIERVEVSTMHQDVVALSYEVC